MVVLSEDAGALLGIGDGVVFERAFAVRVDGRKHDAPASGPQDAVQFAQRQPVVGHVFEQVVADHGIDRRIGQRDALHVEMQVGQRAFQVGRDIALGAGREVRLQMTHDARFGCYVERLGMGVQQVGFAREVEPQQPVAFER